MDGILLDGSVDLHCTFCGEQRRVPQFRDPAGDATYEGEFHQCPSLGVYAPLTVVGMSCEVEKHEREDYVGTDAAQCDNDGRPIMSVTTTRDDGTDCVVLAPTIQVKVTL